MADKNIPSDSGNNNRRNELKHTGDCVKNRLADNSYDDIPCMSDTASAGLKLRKKKIERK
jgi:hypothetical protein